MKKKEWVRLSKVKETKDKQRFCGDGLVNSDLIWNSQDVCFDMVFAFQLATFVSLFVKQ